MERGRERFERENGLRKKMSIEWTEMGFQNSDFFLIFF